MVHHNLVVKGPLFPLFPEGWEGPQGSWDLESTAGALWLVTTLAQQAVPKEQRPIWSLRATLLGRDSVQKQMLRTT